MEYIITFPNTNSAIKSEQLLLAEKLHVRVMPLPGRIRAGCGICLRLPPEEITRALEILSDENVGETGLYERTESGGAVDYREVTDRGAL